MYLRTDGTLTEGARTPPTIAFGFCGWGCRSYAVRQICSSSISVAWIEQLVEPVLERGTGQDWLSTRMSCKSTSIVKSHNQCADMNGGTEDGKRMAAPKEPPPMRGCHRSVPHELNSQRSKPGDLSRRTRFAAERGCTSRRPRSMIPRPTPRHASSVRCLSRGISAYRRG